MTTKMQSRDIQNIRRWATIVGIDHYEDTSIPNLRYSVSDARTLFQLLLTQHDNGFDKERLNLLTTEKQVPQTALAKQRTILQQLAGMADMTQKDDLFLFYFAGHGDVINGEAVLIPSDACVRHLLSDTTISLKRIKEIMQAAPARDKVIILDACYVGVKAGCQATRAFNEAFIKSVFEEAEGMGILTALTRSEASWEDAEIGHGVFTYYLLKGLSGDARDSQTPFISLNLLSKYVTHNMKQWAADNHLAQKPTLEYLGAGEVVLTAVFPQAPTNIHTGGHIMCHGHQNPIERTFPIAVKEIDDFFNRTAVMTRIQQTLMATTDMPIAIRGDRGIGKTSVLNRIKKMLEEPIWNGRQFRHFSISPTGIYTFSDFASEIWDGLVMTLPMSGVQLPESLKHPVPFQTFGRFAAQLTQLQKHTPDITFVVFIDEFGQIIHQCNNLEYNKIEGLINYIVETTDFPLVFILSLLQDLPDSYGSPIPMSIVTLHPLDFEDVVQMVNSLIDDHASLTDDTLHWLYDYTGGHPFYLKLLLTKLFDRFDLANSQKTVTPEMCQQIVPDACRSNRADELLRDVYTTYMSEEERFVLLWLSSHQDRFSSYDVQQNGTRISAAVGQLLRRDFLKVNTNKDHYFGIRFFGDWLRDWPKFAAEQERLEVVDSPPPQATTTFRDNGSAKSLDQTTICIDQSAQEVYVRGQKLTPPLPYLDYTALVYLVTRVNEVVSKDELANHIYTGDYYEGDDQRISAVIYRLRSALGNKEFIQTLRKRGFRIKEGSFA